MRFIYCLFFLVAVMFTKANAQQGFATVKGKIISGNKPLPAIVLLKHAGITTQADSSGNFIIIAAASGKDTLVITAVNIIPYTQVVKLSANTTLDAGLIETTWKTGVLPDVEITGRITQTYKSGYSFAATKTQTAVQNVPQMVSTVTKELIKDKMEFNLRDVFENIAGANTYSGFDEYSIRGLRAENPHLINGLRSYNTALVTPMLANIERVEVLKGPASVLYGNADPGGTINLVTKKPLAEKELSFDVYRGSWNNTRAQADVTGPLNTAKTFLYRLNGAYLNARSFRNQYFAKAFQIAPSFSYIHNDKLQVNADFSISHTNTVADRGQPGIKGDNNLGNTPISLSVTQPGDKLTETDISSIISLSYKINPHITFNSAVLNYITRQQLNEHGIEDYITPDSVSLYYATKTFNTTTFTVSNFVNIGFTTGQFKHQLIAGYDFINSSVSLNAQRYEQPGIYGEGSGIVGTFSLLRPQYLQRQVKAYTPADTDDGGDADEYTTQGAYAQELLTYKKWQLLAGLRTEFYQAGDNEGNDTAGYFKQTAVLPRLSLTYALTGNLTLYATYNNGFDPFEASINKQVLSQAPKPVYSRLYELGAKADIIKNRLLIQAAIYQLTLRNVAVNANDVANPDLYVQRGKERSAGLELEANGNILNNLSASISYAHNTARVIQSEVPAENGMIKENAPRNQSGSWLKYTFSKGTIKGLSIAAGHTQVSQRNTLIQGLTLPGYCVVHAGLAYSYKKLYAALNVYNIANQVYYMGGYNYASKWPGAPRSFMVNVGVVL